MLRKGFDQMVLIQQETTFTIPINPYSVKLKQNKLKNHLSKCKRSKNSDKISLKYKQQQKYKISNNYSEYSVKTSKRTSKCLNLSTYKAIKFNNYNFKSTNLNNKYNRTAKNLNKLIKKNTSIKWCLNWKIWKYS